MDKEIYQKIIAKKELSQLPKKDVERVFAKFDNGKYGDEEKVKLARKLLREMFSAFVSQKLLKLKDKDAEWVLKKHVSTRERFEYYGEIYKRILNTGAGAHPSPLTILDLGAGVNGFSYKFLSATSAHPSESHPNEARLARPKYLAVEAVGQLVDLMNAYFEKEKLNARAIHASLFELEKIKKLIKSQRGKKVVFLFKTLDSLEMVQRDYSKKLLKEIMPLVEKVVVSFAVRSIGKRERFRANRKWLIDFIKENFEIKDDFELGGERYVVFSKR